jgi:hypothetical protein
MFSQQLHRTRLRSFLAYFLGKGYASAHSQARKRPVEHAVPVEIKFPAVTGLDESELAGGIEPRHRPNRGAFMVLHLSLHLAHTILQLPTRPFERIVDGERQVGMPLVRLCGADDIDFPAVRKRQADVDLVEATCAVMTTGRFSAPPGQPSACRNAAQA